MAASIVIETEQGTCAGFVHQHSGYYAGDFSQVPINVAWLQTVRPA